MARVLQRECVRRLPYLTSQICHARIGIQSTTLRSYLQSGANAVASSDNLDVRGANFPSSGLFNSQPHNPDDWRFGLGAPRPNESDNGVPFAGGAAGSEAVDWKSQIRKRVWDTLEAENLAREPFPFHNRIPNFFDADSASNQVVSLPEFQVASAIKVSNDIGQKQMRYLALRAGKILVTPQPRLQSGFFSVLEPNVLDPKLYQEVATATGVAKYARHLGLGARFKLDLVVVGSVAVDPVTGARLGDGEGLAELEYGFLRLIGAVNDSTVIVTSVHDMQLVKDMHVEKLAVYDFPVDIICTPTQIIRTKTSIAKPKGIYWEKLSLQKFEQFGILQELRRRIEQDTGQRLPVGASERPTISSPGATERPLSVPFSGVSQRPSPTSVLGTNERPFSVTGSGASGRSSVLERPIFQSSTSILRPTSDLPFPKQGLFIWCFDDLVTPEELKAHLDKLGITVVKVDVFPKKGPVPAMARALLPGGEDIDRLVAIVDKSDLRGQLIRCQVDKAYEPQPYNRRMR